MNTDLNLDNSFEELKEEIFEGVRLRYVRMINCQSWKDGKIEFSDGLNTISSAFNNTGKSVFMKVLKAVSCPKAINKEAREELIRTSAEYAEVHYVFSDGSASIIRIYPQRILYRFTEDLNSGSWIQSEDIPPQRLINNLNLIVDLENGFVANLLDSEQDLLLVNSNPNLNYNLVRVLTEHETLNRLSNNFKDKLPVYTKELQGISAKADRLRHNRKGLEYVDVDKLEYETSMEETLVSSMLNVIDIYENTLDLEKDININHVEDLDSLYEFGNILEGLNVEDFAIPEETLSYEELANDLETCEQLMNFENTLETWSTVVNLEEEVNRLQDLENLDTSMWLRFGELLEEITIDEELIENDKDEEDWNSLLINVEEIETLNDIVQNVGNLYNLVTESSKLEEEIKALEAIDFEGELFDCPLYGTIQYLNGNCVI